MARQERTRGSPFLPMAPSLPTVNYCLQGSVTLIFICAQRDKQLQLPSVHVLEAKFFRVMRFEYSEPFFLSIGHILLEQVRVANPEVFSDFR